MENLSEIIASNLVLLRKRNNLKQSDVAQKLGYSDKTISKWELGEVTPSVESLVALCKLYNVSLDQITHSTIDVEEVKTNTKSNKLVITLLAISAIWMLATIVFVYAQILSGYNAWIVFVWAVPASMVVAIVFNSIWGKRRANYIYISILVWSLLASFYLQFLQYNLIPLFFLGIPMQIAILLWASMKSKSILPRIKKSKWCKSKHQQNQKKLQNKK